MSMPLLGFGDDLTAARAYRALGATSTRIEILRLILATGETSAAELMDAFALTRNGVTHHLTALTRERLLTKRHATHPRGAGPITYWRANLDEVHEVIDGLTRHLLDVAQPAGPVRLRTE